MRCQIMKNNLQFQMGQKTSEICAALILLLGWMKMWSRYHTSLNSIRYKQILRLLMLVVSVFNVYRR